MGEGSQDHQVPEELKKNGWRETSSYVDLPLGPPSLNFKIFSIAPWGRGGGSIWHRRTHPPAAPARIRFFTMLNRFPIVKFHQYAYLKSWQKVTSLFLLSYKVKFFDFLKIK